ncbi:DNA-processing protein DprA [Brevibacterium samyangense]|uniref:Smf/DprA SLOG domain-containing protein n=1 Tax=Brevibacterium samyangense TaxID=366888 RepID=A0ABN2TCA7_9MICO
MSGAADDEVQQGVHRADARRGTRQDAERLAAADLLRAAEPGDRLLAACVHAHGFERTRALLGTSGADTVRTVATAAETAGMRVETATVEKALGRWGLRVGELDASRDLRVMARVGARILVPGDEDWPPGVNDLGLDAPHALWVRGPGSLAALTRGAVAVVGARAAGAYGLHVTKTLAYDLARAGRTVVSGGAYGIDAAAHEAAIAAAGGAVPADGVACGGTVAFLAGGVDRFYPRENAELLRTVARSWAVASEAAPGMTAMRHRFLMRNRLIAAAADATVVVQAGWRSGALNTANRAAELLRPVAAFPGPVTNGENAGCHRLVREGAATLVTSTAEVLELVEPLLTEGSGGPVQGELRITDDMEPEEVKVFGALPVRRGSDVHSVAVRAGLDIGTTMSALAALELSGRAQLVRGGWVKRTPPEG